MPIMGSNSVLTFQDLLREAKAATDSHRIQVRSKGKQVNVIFVMSFGVCRSVWCFSDGLGFFLFDGKDKVNRTI